MTSDERARLLIKERGHIVLACNNPVRIGTIVGGTSCRGSFSQPFVVIGETTDEDAQIQEDVLFAHGEPAVERIYAPYYYKLTTD